MGTSRSFGKRCAGALIGLAFALTGAAAQAQDAAPSDSEMAALAPSDSGGSSHTSGRSGSHSDDADPAAAAERDKETAKKHVDRRKRISSLFGRLKHQVESMEQVQQHQITQLPPDLPPEALQTEDDPAPDQDAGSVLDEAPRKAPKHRPSRSEEPRELAEEAGKAGSYTVKPGDTLGKIATKLLGTSKKASTIAKANGMSVSDGLKVGRELIIPGAGRTEDASVGDVAVGTDKAAKKSRKKKGAEEKVAKKETTRKPKNPASEPVLDYSNYDFKMYVVKPGDSLSKIAKAFYESGNGAELIRKYNKLGGSAGKEMALKAGEKILIPLPKQKASEERYQNARKGVF